MKLAGTLLALTSLFVLGSVAAKADTIDSISGQFGQTSDPFYGQTYTGTFQVDEQTGDVTDFSADLLNATYTASDLGDAATFTDGIVTSLKFGLAIDAIDGSHNAGFSLRVYPLSGGHYGLESQYYFAFLNPDTSVEGGGTPISRWCRPMTSPLCPSQPACPCWNWGSPDLV